MGSRAYSKCSKTYSNWYHDMTLMSNYQLATNCLLASTNVTCFLVRCPIETYPLRCVHAGNNVYFDRKFQCLLSFMETDRNVQARECHSRVSTAANEDHVQILMRERSFGRAEVSRSPNFLPCQHIQYKYALVCVQCTYESYSKNALNVCHWLALLDNEQGEKTLPFIDRDQHWPFMFARSIYSVTVGEILIGVLATKPYIKRLWR